MKTAEQALDRIENKTSSATNYTRAEMIFFANYFADIHHKEQLIISGVGSSAYMVKVEGKGTMIILAESISDACDKLESKGYKNYAFTKSTSLDLVF